MNILTQILNFITKNIENNVKKYNLENTLNAKALFTFNNYINMVNCIDDISYDFSTYLYSSFIKQIDDAFYNSSYRKQFCDVINICERNIITLFGEVSFERRYYYDKLKNKYYYYVDQVLNIKPYSRFDPFVCAKICEVSSHDSYAKAGRTVSELIGKRLKFNDNKDKILINRAQARNIVMNFDIPNIDYGTRNNVKKLFVMLDEKWVHSQYNYDEDGNKKDFMVKACVVFETVKEVYKKRKKKNSKIRYKLVGKHVLSSIDGDLKKQLDDYIFNTYDVEFIDELVFMGDCASWITAFPEGFKYHKNMKIKFSMDGFHYSQAIENICTKKYQDLVNILKDYCKNNDKESFVTICNSLIDLHPERKETIESKMNYILNNWKYIQVYYYDNPMRCCMESNISHCFADIFTARPRAYSEKGLRQLLKLRMLKVNNQDIQKIYFGVLNNEFKEEILTNTEIVFNSSKKNNDIYYLPQWLYKCLNHCNSF